MGRWTLLAGLFLFIGAVSAGAQEQYLGCYADQGDPKSTQGRDLDGALIQSSDMTPQMCVATCGRRGFAYAGTQFGNTCFCGDQYGSNGPSQACTMTCAGDQHQNCGGVWANAVYKAVVSELPPRPEGYKGCYGDAGDPSGTRGRDLGGFMSQSNDMTPKMCKQTCARKGFRIAGVQYGRFCFCGESFGREGPSEACTMPCAGDPNQTCGGRWANDVYTMRESSQDESATTQEDPNASGAPVPQYLGCWQDRGHIAGLLPDPARALGEYMESRDDMTPCLCSQLCWEKGSTFAGVQFSRSCYCGSAEGVSGGDVGYKRWGSVDPSRCTTTCSGDDSLNCGGNFTNAVWTAGICPSQDIRPDWIDPGFPGNTLPPAVPEQAGGSTVPGGDGGGSGTPGGGSGDPSSIPATGSNNGGGATIPGGGSTGSGPGAGADGGSEKHPQAVSGWIGTDDRQSCISNGREVAAQLSCVAPVVTPEIGLCADPRTLEVIDAFLSQTRPWQGAEYDCWARWFGVSENGSAVTRNNCQRPETDGRTRCQYLLDNYSSLVSPQLGTNLRSYILENLQ